MQPFYSSIAAIRIYDIALDPIPADPAKPWLLLRNGREHSTYATREDAEAGKATHQEFDYLDHLHGW